MSGAAAESMSVDRGVASPSMVCRCRFARSTGPGFGFTTRLVLAMVRLTRCDRRAKIRNIDCQEGALGREDTTHGLPTHARLAGGCQK